MANANKTEPAFEVMTPEQQQAMAIEFAAMKAREAQQEQDAADGVAIECSANGFLNFKSKGCGNRGASMTRSGWQAVLDRAAQLQDVLESKGAAMDASYEAYLAAKKK